MTRCRIFFLCLLLLLPVNIQAQTKEAPLTLLPPQGQNQTAPAGQTIAGENDQLHDIYGPIVIPESLSYGLLAGAAALLTALAALLYWFYTRRRSPAPPVTPPWERAMREISAAKKHLNPQESLVYLEKISLILRKYIELRFAVKSTRQTTGEFLSSLEFRADAPVLQTYRKELQNCLQKADMAKFAHHSAAQTDLENIEESVISFVEKTTPLDQNRGQGS